MRPALCPLYSALRGTAFGVSVVVIVIVVIIVVVEIIVIIVDVVAQIIAISAGGERESAIEFVRAARLRAGSLVRVFQSGSRHGSPFLLRVVNVWNLRGQLIPQRSAGLTLVRRTNEVPKNAR
jgi:hypothetical protein